MRLTGHSPMLVRTAVLASFGVALMSNPAAGPNFQVEVRDSATGELTAARVRLVDMEGRVRMKRSATPLPPWTARGGNRQYLGTE